jgi:hypothetical protein
MISADRSWSKASTTTTVASHALMAVGLENPATLIEKNPGSCTLPNTPSPMAARAPTTNATTTAMLPPELGGTVTGMRSVGGEVAAGGGSIRADPPVDESRTGDDGQCRRGMRRSPPAR